MGHFLYVSALCIVLTYACYDIPVCTEANLALQEVMLSFKKFDPLGDAVHIRLTDLSKDVRMH